MLQAIRDFAVSNRLHTLVKPPQTRRKSKRSSTSVAPLEAGGAKACPDTGYTQDRLIGLHLTPLLGLLPVLAGMMIGLVLLAGGLAFSQGQIPPVRGGVTPQAPGWSRRVIYFDFGLDCGNRFLGQSRCGIPLFFSPNFRTLRS